MDKITFELPIVPSLVPFADEERAHQLLNSTFSMIM